MRAWSLPESASMCCQRGGRVALVSDLTTPPKYDLSALGPLFVRFAQVLLYFTLSAVDIFRCVRAHLARYRSNIEMSRTVIGLARAYKLLDRANSSVCDCVTYKQLYNTHIHLTLYT